MEAYDAMEEKKPIQSKAMRSVMEAYLACLFILMSEKDTTAR